MNVLYFKNLQAPLTLHNFQTFAESKVYNAFSVAKNQGYIVLVFYTTFFCEAPTQVN